MEKESKISLHSAILINTNIMLGTGIFINTLLLSKDVGTGSLISYLLTALLIFPLILCFMKLFEHSETSSTFYDIGNRVNPFFGFIASWSYFISKMASCALGVHVCVLMLQSTFVKLATFNPIHCDILILLLFCFINMFGLRIGKSVQTGFIIMKFIPIIFIITAGIFLFKYQRLINSEIPWGSIPSTIPMVIYAFTGFEASCSISRHIENPKKNGPRAILTSFFIVLTIIVIYQTLFIASLPKEEILKIESYTDIFSNLLEKFGHLSACTKNNLQLILKMGVASSALGLSYGIMYSNAWNLFTLSENNHTYFKNLITQLNRYKIAYLCILIETAISICYLLATSGNQTPLQQVSALGSTIAYTISVFTLFIVSYNNTKNKIYSILGLLSCSLMISSFISSIQVKGISLLLIIFLGLLSLGTLMFYHKHTIKLSNL